MKRSDHWLPAAVAAVLVASWAASPAQAIPPDPDNAALLYYQAFISLGDLDKEARDHIGRVAAGEAPPTEKTREYLSKCGAAIDFADAARTLRTSNWGFRYSQGFEALMPHLAQARFLAFVLLADARVRAFDGDYQGAFERCLQMRTFARHLGDDTLIAYLVGVAVQRVGYECMHEIIGLAAGDAGVLQWLKRELTTADGTLLSPVASLKIEMEIALDVMQMDKLDKFASVMRDPEHEELAKFIASADEALMERARRIYSQYFTSALTILRASKPYAQTYLELKALANSLDTTDPASAIAGSITPVLDPMLSVKTLQEAGANATEAGLEICLIRAETGRLPEVLPEGLPKDPFSGKDFQYQRTRSGFVLCCRGKDLAKSKVYEYAFTVK